MSGYQECHCRDCFEILVGEPDDFCDECIEAGCPDYQGVLGMSQECQRSDAYDDVCSTCGGGGAGGGEIDAVGHDREHTTVTVVCPDCGGEG